MQPYLYQATEDGAKWHKAISFSGRRRALTLLYHKKKSKSGFLHRKISRHSDTFSATNPRRPPGNRNFTVSSRQKAFCKVSPGERHGGEGGHSGSLRESCARRFFTKKRPCMSGLAVPSPEAMSTQKSGTGARIFTHVLFPVTQ